MSLAIVDSRAGPPVVIARGAEVVGALVAEARGLRDTASTNAIAAALSADNAADYKDLALLAALAVGTYADTTAGLAATTNGQYFYTADPANLYLNSSGTAVLKDEIATLGRSMGTFASDLIDGDQTIKDAIESIATNLASGSKGAAKVAFLQDGAGAVLRTLMAKSREVISVTDFGADPLGLVDSAAAFELACTYAELRSFAGNACCVVFPPGRYSYSVSPNWGRVDRIHLDFRGEVWMAKYGTGPAFIMDGGATGAGIHGCIITGWPRIYDDGNNNHCVYMRAVHNGLFQIRTASAGSGFSLFYGEWLVDNYIYLTTTGLEGGITGSPATGIRLTTRGVNEDSSYNRLRVRVSGLSTNLPLGIFLDAALGNDIVGTVQNCDLGYKDTANSWENKICFTDFEANTKDLEIYAQQTSILDCELEVGAEFMSGALDCKMRGGATQSVTVHSGALNTLLSSFTYNRRRVPGTGTLTISDNSTRCRDLLDGTEGKWHDAPPSRTVLTVGASPFTYTNTGGNAVKVLHTGGTVSQLAFTKATSAPVGDVVPVQGEYILSPGDYLTSTYTVAPTMIVYSL